MSLVDLSTIELPSGHKVYVAQYQPTERPIEDRYSVDFEENRVILGVYDGHGGSATSEYVSKTLPQRLLAKHSSEASAVFQELDRDLMNDFTRDHSLLRQKSKNWGENARRVKSGCTALVLDVNLEDLEASYANAGDCRLPTSRLRTSTDYPVGHYGSQRQECLRASEARFRTSKRGSNARRRQTFRAADDYTSPGFGDAIYKLEKRHFLNGPPKKYIIALSAVESASRVNLIDQYGPLFFAYQSPPYLTATPHTDTITLEKGSIVILASDGFWDLISNEEAMLAAMEGHAAGHIDLASYLLTYAKGIKPPGDDVTIVVIVL